MRLRLRQFGLNAADRLHLKRIKTVISIYYRLRCLLISRNAGQAVISFVTTRLLLSIVSYIDMCVYEVDPSVLEVAKSFISISVFENGAYDCETLFRFRGNDLRPLFEALRMTSAQTTTVRLSNGATVEAEQVFLLGLHRLATNCSFEASSSLWFAKENTFLSRCFGWFINHINSTLGHLLKDTLERRRGYFPIYADCIRSKLEMYGLDVTLAENVQHPIVSLFSFIDTTCLPCQKPSGDWLTQKAFYSKYYKTWGLKFQAIVTPDGIIADLYGPTSCRTNDRKIVEKSKINRKLRRLQRFNTVQYRTYGDALYTNHSHVRARHRRNQHFSQSKRNENYIMSKVRIAVEWAFKKVKGLWPYLKDLDNCRIMSRSSSNIAFVFRACVILTNLHTCLYGSQTGLYFECESPTLDEYMMGDI